MPATTTACCADVMGHFFMDDIREASWAAIVYVCALQVVASVAFLWKPGLLAVAVSWTLCIGAGIFAWARQRPVDLGLSQRGILLGIGYGLTWWVLTQAVLLALAFVLGLPLQWPVLTGNIGELIDQLLIFALSEEIVSRGFVMAQLYRKLQRTCGNTTISLTAAILLSQILFALVHLPHRMVEHVPAAELMTNLALTGASGVLFCLLYLRTGNLLVALAVHAVSNVPGLFSGPFSWHAKNLVLVLTAFLLAEAYARRFRNTRSVGA